MAGTVGNKIRLISKAEIRYEGTLAAIDPKANTVSLRDVRMHGTEDRPATQYIAPSQTEYEYIVFRGGDIKDLTVFEQSPQFIDPAIVDLQPSRPPQAVPAAAAVVPHAPSVPSAKPAPPNPGAGYGGYGPDQGGYQSYGSYGGAGGYTSAAQWRRGRSLQPLRGGGRRYRSGSQRSGRSNRSTGSWWGGGAAPPSDYGGYGGGELRGRTASYGAPRARSASRHSRRSNSRTPHGSRRGWETGSRRSGGRRRSVSRSRGGGARHEMHIGRFAAPRAPAQFNEEFDFSNNFDKAQLAAEVGPQAAPSQGFYDTFTNVDEPKPRMTRDTDVETFGQDAVTAVMQSFRTGRRPQRDGGQRRGRETHRGRDDYGGGSRQGRETTDRSRGGVASRGRGAWAHLAQGARGGWGSW
eukprot:TRINITY_DN19078_c0_g1_i1.p1 TRINITY_DN19078_c0_g1~~TRINITY_DN19078_c0_g1_i1.p1  ORF type:complete len:409 (+),score=67.77 TRINITY_DN19078_c0_g1_i1:128-1354(+)